MSAEVHDSALKLERTEGGISCPKCGLSTAVGDSRPHGKSIKRRRYCKCGFRFTTFEHAINEAPLFVEMLDGLYEQLSVVTYAVADITAEVEKIRGMASTVRELEATRYGAAKPLTPPARENT